MGGPRVRLRGIVGRIGEEEREAFLGDVKPMSSDELGAVLELARAEPGKRAMIGDVLRLVAEQRDVNAGFVSRGSG